MALPEPYALGARPDLCQFGGRQASAILRDSVTLCTYTALMTGKPGGEQQQNRQFNDP